MSYPHSSAIITGGAGFIGSAVVRQLIAETDWFVWNVDKLTYAGNLESLREVRDNERYRFVQADICDAGRVEGIFAEARPRVVLHLAAESHVDRSIDGPAPFIQTNVIGTYTLLEAARRYWQALDPHERESFRFVHVSTDEVYGTLGSRGAFKETTAYKPRNPYSASKAASDHLARAWRHTYGLPVVVTNSANNYGPFQFPEKLIPLTILNALEEKPLPIYGTGDNVRDWIYVDDHARALRKVVEQGVVGDTYNVGSRAERTNRQVVDAICGLLDELRPRANGSYQELTTFVADRPGHDRRTAIDPTRLQTRLGWRPQVSFDEGLRQTVEWYLENDWWWRPIREHVYAGQRLGRPT